MELKILEQKKHRLVFELKGVDHTMCNVIKDELWNDANIENAGYNIDHPLVGVPKFVIETKAGSAKDALLNTIKRLRKSNDRFAALVKKEFTV